MKDKKIVLFSILNVFQGSLIGAIPLVVSSREPAVNYVLFAIAGIMILAGPALAFGGRIGFKVAAIACMIQGAVGTVFAALIASAATYLYGIYGHHGHALGSMAFVLVIISLIVFWLIPAHELNFLRKRWSEK